MNGVADQTARDLAAKAVAAQEAHALVVEVKLQALDEKTDRIESILKWVGGLFITLFLSTLTWSLTQQYNANEQVKRDLQAQVELLRDQARREQPPQPLPTPSAAEPPLATPRTVR